MLIWANQPGSRCELYVCVVSTLRRSSVLRGYNAFWLYLALGMHTNTLFLCLTHFSNLLGDQMEPFPVGSWCESQVCVADPLCRSSFLVSEPHFDYFTCLECLLTLYSCFFHICSNISVYQIEPIWIASQCQHQVWDYGPFCSSCVFVSNSRSDCFTCIECLLTLYYYFLRICSIILVFQRELIPLASRCER